MLDDLARHELCGVGGDREGNALGAANDRGIDANDLVRRRHQGPAGGTENQAQERRQAP